MKSMKKAKYFLEAVVTIAILMAFVMPGAAVMQKTSFMDTSHGVKPLPRAEWIEQASGFPTASRGISSISVINESIAWADGYDGLNPSGPCQDYTRTVDGGTTWVANSIAGADGCTFSMIYALDANIAWACMFSLSGGPQGIYKTIDGGNIWVQQTTAAFNTTSFPDCVHFWDTNVGWCLGDPNGGYFEIYTTTDGGTTWNRVPSGNIPAPLPGETAITTCCSVVGDTVWFGTTNGRVYKSTDKGLDWTVTQTTLAGWLKPVFKDANNGLVLEINTAAAELAETSNGGTTWTTIAFTGPCHANDLCYIPGTSNMYISVGAGTGDRGASYSLDGGHNWNDYGDVYNIQLLSLGFTTGKIGWAGSFNTDETTGGIFKHVPSEIPQPLFTIDVTGGKNLTVKVTNIGDGDATNISYTVGITGGLWIKQRDFNGAKSLLAAGANFSFTEKVMGIGLGIIKKPIPSITITVTCSENVTATRTVNAKIFLSKVTLQ